MVQARLDSENTSDYQPIKFDSELRDLLLNISIPDFPVSHHLPTTVGPPKP
jgi:hypothetical protein